MLSACSAKKLHRQDEHSVAFLYLYFAKIAIFLSFW